MINLFTSKIISDLKTFIILLLISLIIFWLDSVHLLGFIQRSASFITNPISFGLYKTSRDIRGQFDFIFKARFASLENKALKEQLAFLLSENAKIRKELAENKSIVSQSLFLDPQTYNLVPARPIGIKRYLKIDKGSNDGIALGEAVVFNDNYLGKIINLSPNSSSIQLVSDPDSKVAAFSQGLDSRGKGILKGEFGSEMLLDKILHEEKVSSGDLVYSEGTEEFLPRGLILGKVTEVLERETQVFKQARVTPNFDIRDLELVFVILEQ